MSRYSQLYIDQTGTLPDSARARHRLGKLMEELITNTQGLSNYLERELGIKIGALYPFDWQTFAGKCEMRDLLDAVTLTFKHLAGSGREKRWLSGTRRIFSEEHLAYAIDDQAVVHPAVDKEFQRNRQATLAGLQARRYANSLAAFERISDELASDPPNGKDAWRAAFGAVEGLFRLMFPSAPQLNTGAVETHLAPLIQKLYGSDAGAVRAASKQVASFKDWVDALRIPTKSPGCTDMKSPGDSETMSPTSPI